MELDAVSCPLSINDVGAVCSLEDVWQCLEVVWLPQLNCGCFQHLLPRPGIQLSTHKVLTSGCLIQSLMVQG